MEFTSEDDAEYASRVMNGIRLYGKPIRVNKASADKQKSVEIGAELFIGNLDPMVSEQIVYDTFSRFGNLVNFPKVILFSFLLLAPSRKLTVIRSPVTTTACPRDMASFPLPISNLQMPRSPI